MKKRVLVIMGLSIMLLAGGCSKSGDLNNKSSDDVTKAAEVTSAPSTTVAEITGIPTKDEYKLDDYITLGEYKGIAVSYTKLTVTDADVDAEIKTKLESNPSYDELDKTVVETGDMVNIDFEGLLDGKAFEGGSASDFKLTIGSGSFIDGFEDGLIGKKVGKKVSIDVTFPEDYGQADLAGKAVVFNVTIKAIVKEVTPKLNDAYVKDNTDYKTVAEYKKSVRDSLEATQKTTMENEKFSNAYNVLLENSKISSIPKELTKYYSDLMVYQYTTIAKNNSLDLKTYITNNNATVESFNSYVASNAESNSTQELLFSAIAKKENITVSDDEYKDALATFVTDYGYNTEEELLKVIPKTDISEYVLQQKVMDYVISNAKITEATPTPAPTATPAAK